MEELTKDDSSAAEKDEADRRREAAGGQVSEAPCWDLGDLYTSPDDPAMEADMSAALSEAEDFSRDYKGKIAVEGGPGPDLMAAALWRYEAILEKAWKPACYARLLHAADSSKAGHGALLSRTQDLTTKIETLLMFFELDWISLPDADAARCTSSPLCARWRHFLKNLHRYRPHTLSEPEEVILAEKRVTGVFAFRRLFDELNSTAKYRVELDGEVRTLNQSEALDLMYSSDRERRIAGHRGFSAGLMESGHLMTFIINSTVQDHAVDMRLKRYENPADARHLANEIDRESVAALMKACEEDGQVVSDYYRLKAKLLGLDELYDYDRYGPVHIDGVGIPTCDWDAACETVIAAFSEFSPRLGEIAGRFFKNNWVDGAIRTGKRGGAFCSPTVPSVHPYILVNFMGKLSDAMTLAHEMGHGVHQYLSRDKGILQAGTPLTLAETASVFGEMLVFQRLVDLERDPRVRLALYCNRIEDSFATVFRQVALTRFEESVHSARADGELSTERLDQLWLEANRSMLGDAVKLTDGYKRWWSYIGHFIHTPFYCYAYSFGELLVLSLWNQYKREGESFVPKYLELLKAGGSDSPAALIGRVGLDIKDPSFWSAGIAVIREMLDEAKRLAASVALAH